MYTELLRWEAWISAFGNRTAEDTWKYCNNMAGNRAGGAVIGRP